MEFDPKNSRSTAKEDLVGDDPAKAEVYRMQTEMAAMQQKVKALEEQVEQYEGQETELLAMRNKVAELEEKVRLAATAYQTQTGRREPVHT